MKYLSHYVEAKQTQLFNDTGAFFAFSDDQFERSSVDGVVYTSMGSGMVCPSDNAKMLSDGLSTIHSDGIAEDIAENGLSAIIQRELGNHEAQITGDIDDTVDALSAYNVTREMVQEEYKQFFQDCIDNDWF